MSRVTLMMIILGNILLDIYDEDEIDKCVEEQKNFEEQFESEHKEDVKDE